MQSFDSTIGEKFDPTTSHHFLTSLVGTRVSVYFVSPLMGFSFESDDIKTLSKEFAKDVREFRPKSRGSIQLQNQLFGSCLEFTVTSEGVTKYHSYMFSIFENEEQSSGLARLPFMCVTGMSLVGLRKRVENFIKKRFFCAIENCCLSDSQMQVCTSRYLLPNANDTSTFILPTI